MLTHAACLLLRREVFDALGEPTEIARPLACPSFGWARGTITLEPFERLNILQDYQRFSPAKFLDAFVDDRKERRETCKHCKQAEDEIQVGMVPTHVQLPLGSRRQRAVKGPATLTPQRVSPNWLRWENCAALPVAC